VFQWNLSCVRSHKKALKGHTFWSDEYAKSVVMYWLQQQPINFSAEWIYLLLGQWDFCLIVQGDYFNDLNSFRQSNLRTGFIWTTNVETTTEFKSFNYNYNYCHNIKNFRKKDCKFYYVMSENWQVLFNDTEYKLMIKSRKMSWAGHVTRMGEKRNACSILVRKPEGKRPLGRPRRRWVENLREIGCGGTDWIDLAQDTGQWRALVNTVMNLRVP
jgi:hypothetical protein